MSKKNDKNRKKRQFEQELQKERDRLAKHKAKEEEKARQLKATGNVLKKKKKNKAIRIRKGVVVRGIKVKDAESKKRIKEILAAEKAMRPMEVENDNDDYEEWEEVPQEEMRA